MYAFTAQKHSRYSSKHLSHSTSKPIHSKGAHNAFFGQALFCVARDLSQTSVVILDEASSRLDLATERIIEQAIEKLFAGRTAIVIAHRLATLQRVDDILIIEDGHMLEQGERETLASNTSSHFSSLLQTGLEEVTA
jgi:ABC-type transport system involved in cytochrome bd biosynthesis fused ATPase/permease subunit